MINTKNLFKNNQVIMKFTKKNFKISLNHYLNNKDIKQIMD